MPVPPVAEDGDKKRADTTSVPSPEPDQQKAGSRAGKHPNSRPGNLSAKTHGAYLNIQKRGARAIRDRHRRRAEVEARTILRDAGLEGSATARLVARQVARLEAMVYRLESFHAARGHFTKEGVLKASVGREIEVVGSLLGEARRLLDQLASLPGASPNIKLKVVHVCEFADGRPARPGGYGPHVMPEPLDPPAPAPAPEPTTKCPSCGMVHEPDDETIH